MRLLRCNHCTQGCVRLIDHDYVTCASKGCEDPSEEVFTCPDCVTKKSTGPAHSHIRVSKTPEGSIPRCFMCMREEKGKRPCDLPTTAFLALKRARNLNHKEVVQNTHFYFLD